MSKETIPSLLKDYQKEKLTKEDAIFVFNQAEKMLKDSIETSTLIVSRTNTLLAIVVTLLITIAGYLINQLVKGAEISKLIMIAAVGFIYIMTLAFYCSNNIKPHKYISMGSMPSDLFKEDFFANNIPNDQRILRYYVNEIENYEFRIKQNNIVNKDRWQLFRNCLWALFGFPLAMICLYFVIEILL